MADSKGQVNHLQASRLTPNGLYHGGAPAGWSVQPILLTWK